jgi:transposase
VAHTILVIAHHLLCDGSIYEDLGANYFDERDTTRTITRAVTRIARLGYDVTLVPKAA